MVTRIAPSIYERKLRRKFSKYGPLENVYFPVAMEKEGVERVKERTAQVTYKNHQDARKAVKGLEGLTMDGAVNPLKAVLMSREGKEVSKTTLAKSRLIIRNLSFQCQTQDVEQIFSQYGAVRDVHIPKKPNGKMLGYAFVQYTSYFDAAKALKGKDGRVVQHCSKQAWGEPCHIRQH